MRDRLNRKETNFDIPNFSITNDVKIVRHCRLYFRESYKEKLSPLFTQIKNIVCDRLKIKINKL